MPQTAYHGSRTLFMDYYTPEHESIWARKIRPDRHDGLEVMADPSGEFRPGAKFPQMDFVLSLAYGVWPAGLVVVMNDVLYTVTGDPGEVIDETGQAWRVSGYRLAKSRRKAKK